MSYNHLTRKERGCIALMWNRKASIREIARELNRNPSTISREIKRNEDSKSYQSDRAHKNYEQRRKRCVRPTRLVETRLVDYVEQRLLLTWSPEQIAGRIRLEYAQDKQMRISHASIYRWLRKGLLARSALLSQCLRHHGHVHGEKRGQFHGVRELKERGREALKRRRLGHWEVDTIVSGNLGSSACILNAVDRKSRYCVLAVLKNRTHKEVMRGFTLMLPGLPVKTITADRGKEFACYEEVEKQFGALFYFARPRSPWQKPTVENTNGLIRQFFPKGTDFIEVDQAVVEHVMQLLNNRPRKSLDWLTPAEVLERDRCS